MTEAPLATISYEDREQQVSWCGVNMEDGAEFNLFLANDVASRFYDKEESDKFEAQLQSLANTGFARVSLDAVLLAKDPELIDWKIGEAIAEAYLAREYNITWPWNMERDKRNPRASLPGADLIGFRIEGENVRLVLGEVKTSSNPKTPPGVMNGRSGMTYQIDKLANNLSLIYQLLNWLWHRCKGTEHEASFKAAIGLFLNAGNKAIALFGVLIRDTQPNEQDLQTRGQTLARTLQVPTTCHLIAIYLPCAIASLPARVSGGGT